MDNFFSPKKASNLLFHNAAMLKHISILGSKGMVRIMDVHIAFRGNISTTLPKGMIPAPLRFALTGATAIKLKSRANARWSDVFLYSLTTNHAVKTHVWFEAEHAIGIAVSNQTIVATELLCGMRCGERRTAPGARPIWSRMLTHLGGPFAECHAEGCYQHRLGLFCCPLSIPLILHLYAPFMPQYFRCVPASRRTRTRRRCVSARRAARDPQHRSPSPPPPR